MDTEKIVYQTSRTHAILIIGIQPIEKQLEPQIQIGIAQLDSIH